MCCLSVRGCNQASRHTPQSAGQGRVSGCWKKSLKTAMDPPSMENFAVKMKMSGVDEIQILGGGTAVWPLSLLLLQAAETQTLPVQPCCFFQWGCKVSAVCVYWSPVEVCLQLKHGSDWAGVGSSPNFELLCSVMPGHSSELPQPACSGLLTEAFQAEDFELKPGRYSILGFCPHC